MALERIVSMVLRAAQLVFAAIVAGVNGEYLHKANGSSWELGRQIYTEVVAGIAIFLALLRLFPFASNFFSWPVDIFMSILWWVAFGLLVDVSPPSRPYPTLEITTNTVFTARRNSRLRWSLELVQHRSSW
jgi:hypothetical protein